MECKNVIGFGGKKEVERNLRQGTCVWKCLLSTENGARKWRVPAKPAVTWANADSTKSFKQILNNSDIVQSADIYVNIRKIKRIRCCTV
jgi:hypothetical protein